MHGPSIDREDYAPVTLQIVVIASLIHIDRLPAVALCDQLSKEFVQLVDCHDSFTRSQRPDEVVRLYIGAKMPARRH